MPSVRTLLLPGSQAGRASITEPNGQSRQKLRTSPFHSNQQRVPLSTPVSGFLPTGKAAPHGNPPQPLLCAFIFNGDLFCCMFSDYSHHFQVLQVFVHLGASKRVPSLLYLPQDICMAHLQFIQVFAQRGLPSSSSQNGGTLSYYSPSTYTSFLILTMLAVSWCLSMLTCLLSSFSESSVRARSIQGAFLEHVTFQSKPQVKSLRFK